MLCCIYARQAAATVAAALRQSERASKRQGDRQRQASGHLSFLFEPKYIRREALDTVGSLVYRSRRLVELTRFFEISVRNENIY